MASSLAVPRLTSSNGLKGMPNLPVIQHPMSRLGNRGDLTVRGSGSIRRDKSSLSQGLGSNPLRKSAPDRILQWPPEHEQGPYKSRSRQSEFGSRNSNFTVEIKERIREKFSSGTHGLRHMFRANDPSGKGNVSREALLRIMYSVIGYISQDQYNKFLKSNGLDGKESISFETFVSSFQDKETSKQGWVNSLQTSGDIVQKTNPEPNLRRTDMNYADPYISAPFADSIFKDNVKTIHDAKKVFPEACFVANGRVVPPQLREAYAQMGVFVKDVDFTTLWHRYDKEGVGAIRTNLFLKRAGVDISGRPRTHSYRNKNAAEMKVRPKSDLSYATVTDLNELKNSQAAVEERLANASKKQTPPKKDENKNKQDVEDVSKSKSTQGQNPENTKPNNDAETEAKVKALRKKRLHPKLENVIDCLHYRFEESYHALLAAFDLFDYLSDGYISRVDFRRVLQEFGFNMTATEFDTFLTKNGIRTIRGQINYREFLNRFQSKSENSITNRIISNPGQRLQNETTIAWPQTQKNLTSEELEINIVDLLHGEFMKLINNLKSCDKYNLGVITKHEFRLAIEKCLGYPVSERQWEQLLNDVGTDLDGLVPYTKFLQMFEVPPGSWNNRQEGNWSVLKVSPHEIPTPLAVERLREKAKTYMQPQEIKKAPRIDNVRTLADIHRLLEELFRTKLHVFDKHFKDMDRKMIGRMSKWQFGALLRLCGLNLIPSELDRLWATLNVSEDGMYSYSTLLNTYAKGRVGQEYENPVEKTSDVQVVHEVQKERTEVRSHEVQRSKTEVQETVTREVSVKHTNTHTVTGPKSEVQTNLMIPPGTSLSIKSVRTRDLLNKIKSQVIGNWDGLKSVFKFIDRNGIATISISEMKEVIKSMNFGLTEEEIKELCQRFDLRRDGRFHYLEFMKCYSKQSSTARAQPLVYSKDFQKLEKKIKAELRNLRRAFWRTDSTRRGSVSIDEFKRILKGCNIEPAPEDFYHILNEFDHGMNGRIPYQEFLETFVDN